MADLSQTQDAPTPAELIEREAAGRNRAGLAALLSAVFVTFAYMISQIVGGDAPGITLTDALQDAAGERASGTPGTFAPYIAFVNDKVALIGLQTLLEVFSWAGFAIVLLYLFHAAKGRRPETKSWLRQLVIASVSAVIVGTLLRYAGHAVGVHDFVNGTDKSNEAARDALSTAPALIGQLLSDLGRYAVLAAWALVSLHAMRAGLLTKFLGTLGVLGAILTAILIQIPIIQIFWLVVVGMTILGRFSTPPAWTTGTAVPWPTQQEIRELRERAREEQAKPAKKTANAKPEAKPAAGKPSPATSARKRKRRS